MNEIFSRIHLNARQIAAVALFLGIAAVAQMCIPSLLGVMIDKGVGSGSVGRVAGIAVAMVALAAVSCGTSVAAARLAAAVTTKFSADLRREVVEKKDGAYHAAVAQGGTNFSGGQRQRLAIARAVMKKPEIYVFDDSFSALDMKTDRQVRRNLKESMGGATMIVVAQRVNTIRDATRILVLENGAVAGMGTHRELLETCKLYREIAEIQLGEKEVAAEIAGTAPTGGRAP